MFKKISLFLIMIFLLTGCFKPESSEDKKRIETKLTQHLKDKYNIEFEIESISNKGYMSPNTYMYAYEKGKDKNNPFNQITVAYLENNNQSIIVDDYMDIVMQPYFNDLSKSIATKYFENVIGNMPNDIRQLNPNKYTLDYTFSDYMDYKVNTMTFVHDVYIGYDGSIKDLEIIVNNFENDLKKTYKSGRLNFYCYPKDYFIEEITRNPKINYLDNFSKKIRYKYNGKVWGEVKPVDFLNNN